MEEEKWIKDEAKRKKEEAKKWGAKISASTLKTQPKVELTQSTQKKILFKVFKYLSNSKFSIQNFQSQIFNSTLSMPKF